MKKVYPVILTPCKEGGYSVAIPDFEINTQGDDLAEAIDMARDAISLCAICIKDDLGQDVPEPFSVAFPATASGDIVTYVDVDFSAYRKEIDTKAERISVTIPANMKAKAKAAGLNLSQELQARLREVLSAV